MEVAHLMAKLQLEQFPTVNKSVMPLIYVKQLPGAQQTPSRTVSRRR